MKIHLLLVFTLFISVAPAIAQKEVAVWYFGNNAGLDFNLRSLLW